MTWIASVLKGVIGVAGCSALLVGVALVALPRPTLWLASQFNRYDPVARMVAWFDRRRFIERYVYRHNQAFGAFILLGAAYATVRLVELEPAIPVASSWAAVATLAAVRFLWIVNVPLIVVGAVILLRPSALKGLEKWANRWAGFDARGGRRRENAPFINGFLDRAPRLVGGVLLLVGIYLVSLITIR